MTDYQGCCSQLSRRKALTTVVSGAIAATAGCAGSDDDPTDDTTSPENQSNNSNTATPTGITEDDIPDFAVDDTAQPTPLLLAGKVVDSPNPIRFLDHFTVELAVGNAGGATLSDQSTEVATQFPANDDRYGRTVTEPEPVTVSLPEIESGDWDTVEAELRVTAGGSWTISSNMNKHPAFDQQLEVQPQRLAAGDSVASDNGHFEITALEPGFERALQYETEEGGIGLFNEDATGLFSASEGSILVLHRFQVENTSSERSLGFGQVYSDNRFTNAEITGQPTEIATSDAIRDDLTTLLVDDYGTVFQNNNIPPSEKRDLLVVQEVSEENLTDASITLSLWSDTREVVFDTVAEPPALPRFDLIDASISAESDDPVIEATVENVGDSVGTFHGAGQFYESRPTASDWVFLPEGMEATVEPGEQVTVSTVASRGDDRFRILPFETELTL